MKYHKLHKASFRQSIAFLMLMIVGITLPIACSDLRGPDAVSMEELEDATLQLQDPKVSINGVNIQEPLSDGKVETPGLGALLLNTTQGIFKIAPRRFDGATQVGQINDNTLSFQINEMKVEVSSSAPILSGIEESAVWVQHLPHKANNTSYAALTDASGEIPPPPPSPINSKAPEGDYFQVVQEMPRLIGGMRAIQSKIEYPRQARKEGIEGQVVVRFIINENGDIVEPEVVRGIGGGADEEALRVVKEAKFEPGKQRGKPVRVQYAMAINFKLQNSDFSSPPQPPSNQE